MLQFREEFFSISICDTYLCLWHSIFISIDIAESDAHIKVRWNTAAYGNSDTPHSTQYYLRKVWSMLEISGFWIQILTSFYSIKVYSGNLISGYSQKMPSLLDALRQRSVVDCDTLDSQGMDSAWTLMVELDYGLCNSQVAQNLGPFVDCTSNQVTNEAHAIYPATGHWPSICVHMNIRPSHTLSLPSMPRAVLVYTMNHWFEKA